MPIGTAQGCLHPAQLQLQDLSAQLGQGKTPMALPLPSRCHWPTKDLSFPGQEPLNILS